MPTPAMDLVNSYHKQATLITDQMIMSFAERQYLKWKEAAGWLNSYIY